MKYLKPIVYPTFLIVIIATYFMCGYAWSKGTIEPEVVEVPTPYYVEVPVEVETPWEVVQVFGVSEDGKIVQLTPDMDETEFAYIVTLSMNFGDYQAEVTVWVPWGDGTMAGIPLQIPTLDFQIEVRVPVADRPLPPAPKPDAEGEEF